MQSATCPDDAMLAQLLAGLLPAEQAELYEPHLAHCERCAARAVELSTIDELAAALRDTRIGEDSAPAPDTSHLAALIERLGNLTNHPNVAYLPTEDELRSVLRPAECEGDLGRIGDYRVLEVLGAGAMGIVFRAIDVALARPVAIKVMRPQLSANRDACLRFRREACAAAAFEHKHVVTIYHVGEDQGTPFFVMQLLEGESLRSHLMRVGKLPVPEVLRIGREIALGLDAAHRRGLLHRDIKPDNVWLEADAGQVKIVDFGLARAADGTPSITHAGTILGTPQYMAPEQIRGDAIDERCDLFSLGSLLYHAATGHPPFSGSNVMATLLAVSHDRVAPPRQLVPELPEPLSDLILQLMEKSPADRIQTAAEVVQKIAQIEQQPEQLARSTQTQSARGRNKKQWLVALAGSIVLAALAILYVATNHGTLIVEADDSVSVAVEQGLVTIRDRASGHEWVARIGENRLRSGAYEIQVKEAGSGIEISAPELSILRGEERRVRLTYKKDASEPRGPAEDNRVIPDRTASQPPAWLSESDASLNLQPGEPLSSVALVSRPAKVDKVISWTVEPVEHRSTVNDLAFSPDGALVATAGQDGTVRVWDVRTRALRRMIACPGPVRALDWSRDGRFLATAQVSGVGSICIWELNEPAVRLVRKINRPATTLAWSEDGRFLAFEDGGIRFWDCESGQVEVLVQSPVNETFSRRPWAIDGPLLVSTCEGFIKLWDMARRQPTVMGEEDGRSRSAAIWSRQGSYVACVTEPRAGEAKTPQSGESAGPASFSAEIWDVQKRQRIRSFTIGAGERPPQLSWSPDASLLITQMENETAIWDVSTGTRRTVIPEKTPSYYRQSGFARNVVWSPDGKTIGLLMSGEVTLWNTVYNKEEMLAGSRGGVGPFPTSFLTEPGLLVAKSGLGGAAARILWDLQQLRPIYPVQGKPRFPLVYLSPDGKRLAAVPYEGSPDSEFEIQISDVTTGQADTVRLPLQGNAANISACWSPDCSQLAVRDQRQRQLFVIKDLKIVHKFTPEDDSVASGGWLSGPVWSPDSTRLAFHDEACDEIRVMEVASGDTKLILRNEKQLGKATPIGDIDVLAWSRDGVHVAINLGGGTPGRISGGSPRRIAVWNVTGSDAPAGEHSNEPASRLPARSLYFARSTDTLISPDSKFIASARGAAVVTVWNITSGEQVAEIGTPCKEIAFAGWMSDSRHIYFLDGFIAGIADVISGQVTSRSCNADVSSRVLGPFGTVQDENTIGYSDGHQVYFADRKLNILSTLVLPSAPDTGALSVQPDGSFRLGPNAPQPYIVALVDGSQWMLTPDEFTRQYGWRNQPVDRDFAASETDGPK
jgi:serine/threonine protein kinase/WD40 repeat protein